LVGLAGAAFGLAAGSDFLTSAFFTGAAAFFTLACAMIFFVFFGEKTCLKLDTLYSEGTPQGERFLAWNYCKKLTYINMSGHIRPFGVGVKKRGLIFASLGKMSF
jgi:hypothetical protein